MPETHDSNAQPQPTATQRTWDAPLHPLGYCDTTSPHPVLHTPLGYAATHMLQALGLNGQQVHLATLQQPGNSACHDYLAHDANYAARLALVQQDQDNRWSAFFRANGGPKNEHVQASAVVQIDFDGLTPADYAPKLQALVDAGLPAPTLALCTGSGTSLHAYWRLQQPWPIADGDQQVGNLQRLICRHFDGDLHSTNPARMMRLAGSTYYAKKTGDPIGTAHVVWHDAANPNGYTFDTLWQWGQANQLPTRPATPYDPNEYARLVQAHANPNGSNGETGSDEVYRVNGSLALIDPDPYDDWLKVGMVLHEAGYPLETWDSWAKASPKYNGYEGHEQKWRSFGNYQGPRLHIGTLVQMARRPGGDPTWLRPSPGKVSQQQRLQAAHTALQDALGPAAAPAPAAPAPAAPAPAANTGDALVAEAEALRNHKKRDGTPILDAAERWPALLLSAGQLQAMRPPGITPMQVAAIIEHAVDSGIGSLVAKGQIKLGREDAIRQRQQQRAQEAQRAQLLQDGPPTPPGVQILGLAPDSNLVLRTALGQIETIPPSTWCSGNNWAKWAPLGWIQGTDYNHPDNGKPDPLACYAAWHAYAATLPVCIPGNVRGLGVHYEDSTRTIVWHTGRCLVVSPPDAPTYQAGFADYQGEHHYIAHHGASNLPPGTQPLPDAQGQHLLQLLQTPGLWGGPNDGIILAGWAVLAALGQLPAKRPHLVLTGDSSNGKSWTADRVLRPLLGGDNACHTSSACTEPGLRASMGDGGATNTLPFLVDEQENKRQTDDAMEALQRTAFEGGYHVMGSSGGGKRQRQYVASALCTIGINQGTDTVANINRRLTVVRKTLPGDQWPPLQQALMAACTVATGQALVLRTVNHGHTIQNEYVPAFEAALAPHYTSTAGTRKLEIMALVTAHAYSLCTTDPVDAAGATAWLQQRGWDFAAFAADSEGQEPEGHTMLRTVLSFKTQVYQYLDGMDNPTHQTVTLRTLLETAQQLLPTQGSGMHADSNAKLARQHLADTWGLYLMANTHAGHLLWATGGRGATRQAHMANHNTAGKWGKGGDARKRLEGLGLAYTDAVRLDKAQYPKEGGKLLRGVAIPLAWLDDAGTDNGQDLGGAPCDPPLW